jgi:ABC-type polysaccharide/polyol phosphate transport system ATPase subunit
MNKKVVIQLNNVSKEYIIHHEKPTLVEQFIKSSHFHKNERFLAINNIELNIYEGDRVGLIGPNGSGKTTLLKLIGGITSPTTGSVNTFGKIVSLIDLEAGFHNDLAGYKNIYLCGAILGMSRKYIDEKIGDIIGFADIRGFIDAPLFTYSMGMKLRLGVAIALYSNPDILLMDEEILTGDYLFYRKLYLKLKELLKHKMTIIYASHILKFIKDFCNKIIVIREGNIIYTTSANKLVWCRDRYRLKVNGFSYG